MAQEKSEESRRTDIKPLSLRLTEDLEAALTEAASETGLSKSDLARLAIERGLKILLKQLADPVEPKAA